ncbi:hypothetical protein STSP_30880 [Streptomyces jeddahensis]|uniref:Uncharacterized protein n=1 Tax=Streptomyces jeddahensis TaxID=1716141 RepID=A0A177HQX8_9ACTN|nr:hypothetical protein STSP_30880 [Streptomyces jeddahensis]
METYDIGTGTGTGVGDGMETHGSGTGTGTGIGIGIGVAIDWAGWVCRSAAGRDVDDADVTTEGGDDAGDGVGDNFGSQLVRGNAYVDALPAEGGAVPVPEPLGEDVTYERGVGSVEGEVEEPGPGDLDTGDPGRAVQPVPQNPLPQDLGDLARRRAGGTGELQGDVTGVVPAPARPGPFDHDPCGHGHAQLPVIHSTTHCAQHGTGQLDGGHGDKRMGGGGWVGELVSEVPDGGPWPESRSGRDSGSGIRVERRCA